MSITKKFSAEILRELLWDEEYEDEQGNEYKVVETKIIDTTRWSIIKSMVFTFDNKYYHTTYSVGATEYQDERPFENTEIVECQEVEPYEVITIEYRPVK